MKKNEIESLPQVIEAARVLQKLEESGLKDPAIASGWIRGLLTDIAPSDIDVSYVGDVHFEAAQALLRKTLADQHIDPEPWDISGIWNAEIAKPYIRTIKAHFLRDYVCSIDSVFLATDGKLHDASGYGLNDASQKVLRLNPLLVEPAYTSNELVYIYLEGCRRIMKLGWEPTPETSLAIRDGV